MFKFLSTLPVWKQGIPWCWQLSKQISNLFLQMSAHIPFLAKLKGEVRPFSNGKVQTYSTKYLQKQPSGVALYKRCSQKFRKIYRKTPVNVAKLLSKNNFFKNTSWQLLLYLLHVRVILTIIKVFIILFLLVRIGNILAIYKINQ